MTRFGVVAGEPVGQLPGVYKLKEVREKPTPTEAELHMRVAGNRAGYYLGFFGIHVLQQEVFSILDGMRAQPGSLGLSPAPGAVSAAIGSRALASPKSRTLT